MNKTFITIGKTQNLTTIQEGIDYYLKQSSNICKNPHQYFAFTLFIDPGYYDESFILPENINIVGRDKHSVIIAVDSCYNQNRISPDNDDITNNSNTINLVELNNNNQLKNLTIQVTTHTNTQDIKTVNVLYSRNKSNILFDNILLIDNNTINCMRTSLNFISIYGGRNNTIKCVDATLNGNYKTLTAIYCKQTTATIQNTTINIYNESTNNYCIYLELNTIDNINITNTTLKIESGGNNYGILHNNSYSSINACSVTIIGEEGTLYNNAIKCISSSNNYFAKIETENDRYELTLEPSHTVDINSAAGSSVLNVNNTHNIEGHTRHYIVNLKPRGTEKDSLLGDMEDNIDFIYYGFVEGQLIRGKEECVGNGESNIYKVMEVSPHQLRLQKLNTGNYRYNKTYSDDECDAETTIKLEEIINIDIIGSFLTTAICDSNIMSHQEKRYNNCIQTTDPLNIYNIHLHKSTIQGGNLEGCSSSNIIIDTPLIVNIGKYNSHYQTLSEALSSVKDNNTYIFHITPGIYEEPNTLDFKKNITVVGGGVNSTIIKLTHTTHRQTKNRQSVGSQNSLINLDSNVSIKGVAFHIQYRGCSNNNSNSSDLLGGITTRNLINCIDNTNICFDDVNINVELTPCEDISLIHFNKSSFVFNNTHISLKLVQQETSHLGSSYKINFINSHLSDGSLNSCSLKYNSKETVNMQEEYGSTIVGIANYSSDLTLNGASLNMIHYAFITNGYYYRNYIMKVNDSVIILNELGIKSGIKSDNSIIKYDGKNTMVRVNNDGDNNNHNYNGHEGVVIFNNTQFNKPISDTYIYQEYLTIICNHCYLIMNNSKLDYMSLNRYGCLEEEDTNLIIGKISLENSPKNLLGGSDYENTQNNIMIGNHLNGQIIGSNNIIVSNKKSNNTSHDKTILYKTCISNTLIIHGHVGDNIITGCLNSNMISINKSDLYNLDIHKSNHYTDNVMLNINGAVNASHYLNFSGSQNIRFKDHQHKNNVKKGMLLSVVEGSDSLADVIHTSITSTNKDAKCIGVYLGESIVKITDISPNSINKYDFMITHGKAEVYVIDYSIDECDDNNINIGDYLTSSDMCGYAIKQNDNICYNYTVCKALQQIRWDTIDNHLDINQKKYKIAKVYCLIV